jgi:hypothetical protein
MALANQLRCHPSNSQMTANFPANAALVSALILAPGADSLLIQQRTQPVALEAADCERLNRMFGDFSVGRASQHAKVPMSVGRLEVRPPGNGGVQIEKGAGREYSVTACIAAGAATQADAQRLADAVRLRIDGNRVTAENLGTPARSWSVQIVVEVPDGGSVDAETANGPISITGVSGKFSARASNGPISVDDVNGQVTAQASNGPISVSGSRGDVDAVTTNGPIAVHLKGSRWEGRLEARASNGPLEVLIPRDYRSGVEISSSGGSPWDCNAAACRGTSDWDRNARTLRVGPEPVIVRVSTVNGPVAVRDVR